MENFKKTKLHKNLKDEHRKHLEMRPMLNLTVILFSCFVLLLTLYLVNPLYGYQIAYYLFITSAVGGAIIFAASYLLRHHKVNKTAQIIDNEHQAQSRLETTWELRKTQHPLKDAQQKDTSDFFKNHKFSYWGMFRILFVSVLLLISCANTSILNDQRQRYIKAIEKQQKEVEKQKKQSEDQKAKKQKKKKKQILDFAEIKLVLPESETRAKPLDELEWSGVGKSSKGLNKVTISVYLNGQYIKDIEPETAPSNKAGNIKVNGYLALDEFNVKPFDLISYHLTAYSDMNGKPQHKIISSPQFIEVRPFREDAFFAAQGGGGQKMLNILIRFLQLQVIINKATFTARIMRQQALNQETQDKYWKFFKTVKKEQIKLQKEVGEFLRSKMARDYPADAINNVEKASDYIEACCLELDKLTPEFKNDK